VTAGPGVTVDGNGSTSTPYVISSSSAATPTPLEVTDTPTVDLSLSGTGVAGDPYEVSAAVVLDPTPPGGGTNLVHAGADGLYVECADVRGCLSGGDGIDYDPATGEIAAQISADAGNAMTLGGDGGLYAPAASAADPTVVEGTDTPTVDVTVSGTGAAGDPYEVSAAVVLDPTPPGGGTNLIHAGADGLYAECADVRGCLSAGDGIAYDPGTGEIAAEPTVVEAGTNVTVSGTGTTADPYVVNATGGGSSTPTEVEGTDTPTVDVTVSGTGAAGDPYQVSAAVVLDPTPPGGGTNLVHAGADGLFVECADVRGCLSGGDGIDYDPATGEIAAQISADAGNAMALGGDGGLYAPAPAAPETACGLTGDGSAADPLAAAVGTWAYGCDVDTYAGQVYCDTTGQLRSEPPSQATYTQDSLNQSYTPTAVPTGFDNVIETRTLSITNPDPCRPAFVVCEVEVDVDFDLVPGAAAAAGITTDEMQYFHNTGSATQQDVHCQVTKVYNRTIAPGATLVEPLAITMGRGAGGATYNRIQSFMRAFVFNL
jgi:hypothetical protein